jgi:hypothetical protein
VPTGQRAVSAFASHQSPGSTTSHARRYPRYAPDWRLAVPGGTRRSLWSCGSGRARPAPLADQPARLRVLRARRRGLHAVGGRHAVTGRLLALAGLRPAAGGAACSMRTAPSASLRVQRRWGGPQHVATRAAMLVARRCVGERSRAHVRHCAAVTVVRRAAEGYQAVLSGGRRSQFVAAPIAAGRRRLRTPARPSRQRPGTRRRRYSSALRRPLRDHGAAVVCWTLAALLCSAYSHPADGAASQPG